MKFHPTAFVFAHLALHVAGKGTQFVTGPCSSDSDCAEGCCAFLTGLCAGPAFAQESPKDGGCGFGDATPNNNAALALGFAQAAPGVPGAGSATAAAVPPASPSTASTNKTAGSENVGNGHGAQFITGQCSSDADCQSTCCAFSTGLCAAVDVAEAAGSVDGGCGFGSGAPDTSSAASLAPSASSASPASTNGAAGSGNVGNGAGKQFITGQCLSDADCASTCCAFLTGLCAAVDVAEAGGADGGCGFGSGAPTRRHFWA